jgi:hypothetical protein
MRGYMRRTTPDATMAPTFRLRANSRDEQNFHEVVINSFANGAGFMPSLLGSGQPSTPVDLLFEPPIDMYRLAPADQSYYLNFDLLSFDPNDDPTGGFALDRVDLFRIPQDRVSVVAPVNSFDMDTFESRANWQFIEYTGIFPGPTPGEVNTALTLSVPEEQRTESFGAWETRPGVVTVAAPADSGRYFVRMRSFLTAEAPAAASLPDLRMRMLRADLGSAVLQGAIPAGSPAVMVPTLESPRQYHTYLTIAPGDSSPFGLTAALDSLSFGGLKQTTPDRVFLEDVRLELVRINDYPAPETVTIP